jgi:putative nucleotidyltransferase with HDIG domain
MSSEKFALMAQALFSFANELSVVAYQNVQQARFIAEQQRGESEVRALNKDLERSAEERRVLAEKLATTVTAVIDVVGEVSEMRDPYTAGHQRRVAQIASAIAAELDMPEAEISDIRIAGLMHDVGKMSIPAEILSKPTALSAMEFELIKGHAEAGYNIIASAHMQGPIAEFVYQHHERCDGSGYPRGLTGDQLLDGSKVLMVADVAEAMMSHRPYRAALGQEAALAEIEQGAGRLYDLEVAEACLRIFREKGFAFAAA